MPKPVMDHLEKEVLKQEVRLKTAMTRDPAVRLRKLLLQLIPRKQQTKKNKQRNRTAAFAVKNQLLIKTIMDNINKIDKTSLCY